MGDYRGRPPRVGFLIIGTQKAGTTALVHHLSRHEDIGFAKSKELHFFDRKRFYGLDKLAYKYYESKFDFNSGKKIYGEATPIYLYWNDAPQRIYNYNPAIKLIAILRNPIDRAFSNWNMEVDRGNESLSFSEAIRNEATRVKRSYPYQDRLFSYVDRGFYSKQILRYQQLFQKDQMLFLKYEDYFKDQQGTMEHIFQFLELNSGNYTFQPKTVHKRKYHSDLNDSDRDYLRRLYSEEITNLENMLDWDLGDWG